MRPLILALPLALLACGNELPSGADAAAGPEDASASTSPDAGAAADVGTAGSLDAGQGGPDASTLVDASVADPCAKPVQTLASLEVTPGAVTVEKGQEQAISVTGHWSSGCVKPFTSAFFQLEPAGVASVVEAGGGKAVRGLAKGAAKLTASSQEGGKGVVSAAVDVTVTETTAVPTETRGVWVTRFAFSNANDVKGIIQRAAAANFNAVFFQVRGIGDAYYQSSLAPWWKSGTGTLGKDPGWDPLQVAITEAHAHGMQLHAYINAMSGWTKTGTTPQTIPDSYAGAPQHVLKQHPEWTCLDDAGKDSASEYTFIAADAGYRDHFAAIAEEIVLKYDVDGIHLDRIRTPGPKFCHSPGLDAAYAAQYGTDTSHFADFQREQINQVVKAVYDKIVLRKSKVVFSAAVWGIYKKLPGCNTSEGYSGYYQDSLAWTAGGYIDMLNPMIYWAMGSGCTDWGRLVDTFDVGMNGRLLVAGQHALDADAFDMPKVKARIDYARQKKLAGNVVFASSYLDSKSGWDDFLAGPYQAPIAPAPMTHR